MNWANFYVGAPFDEDDGETIAGGMHCWGLVRRVYSDRRGITLPAHSEVSACELIAIARRLKQAIAPGGSWPPVPKGEEQEFDVLVMIKPGHPGEPFHVGVITADRRVLHVEEATAAVCVPLDHPSIRHRSIGAFRYRPV